MPLCEWQLYISTSTLKSTLGFPQSVSPSYALQGCSFSWHTAPLCLARDMKNMEPSQCMTSNVKVFKPNLSLLCKTEKWMVQNWKCVTLVYSTFHTGVKTQKSILVGCCTFPTKLLYFKCCIFWPVFGCCLLQMLREIFFFMFMQVLKDFNAKIIKKWGQN